MFYLPELKARHCRTRGIVSVSVRVSVVLCLLFPCVSAYQATPELTARPVERTLGPGDTQVFQISAASGEFVHLEIRPQGLPLEGRLLPPSGAAALATVNEPGEQRTLPVSFVAEAAGVYRLELRLTDSAAAPHTYEIRLADRRTARPDDVKRVDAERVFAAAKQLQLEGSKASLEQAAAKFATVVPLWQALSDKVAEALTHESIGDVYWSMGRPADAGPAFQRSLDLAKASGDPVAQAGALINVGILASTLGNTKAAIDDYQQAIILSHSAGDTNLESTAVSNLGQLYTTTGDALKALEYAMRARELKHQVGDRRGEMLALANIGMVYSSLGEPRKALDAFNEVLPFRQTTKDIRGQAYTLLNMATAWSQLGELRKAFDAYQQAIPLSRAAGDKRGETIAISNLGVVELGLSDLQGALASFSQALSMSRAESNRFLEESVLNNMSRVYLQLGQPEKALEFSNQALAIQRRILDKRGEGVALASVGAVLTQMGEPAKAMDNYRQALPLLRAVKDRSSEADTLSSIGALYMKEGKNREALGEFEQSLALAREIDDRRREGIALVNVGSANLYLGDAGKAAAALEPGVRELESIGDRLQQARGLYFLARLDRVRGDLTQAREHIDQALAINEDIRTTVVGQELRSSYFSTVLDEYEFRIDLLMALHRAHPSDGYDAQAFETAERARARSLLDLLTEAGADIRQGVDPALLERERTITALLRAKAQRRIQLLAGKRDTGQAAALDKDLQSLTTQYEALESEIRSASPRYAALVMPQPLTLAEIRREVLDDPNTLLLEYAAGADRSFLWAVSRTSVRTFELPKRSELEALARRAYEVSSSASGGSPAPLAEISKVLLAPVAAELGSKRLVIVATDALQYVPFACLPSPVPAGTSEPLIVRHEIVSLPSASTLALIRRDFSGRARAPKTLAVLADPVFSADDPRVSSGSSKAAPSPDTERGAPVLPEESFTRLPSTRTEAEDILALAPANSRLGALDFDANRSTATNPDLGRYRYLHFASHGVLNSRHPELSGLVLSLVDREGRRQNGFLQSHEIYNLKLNADLVTLSACQTALGAEIRGEGLVGLTRGFIYAGVPRVVASMWSVPDRSTAELMSRFYRFMLVDGRRPADALRQAQMSIWKEGRWGRPYYWAAFTIQGEWK